MCLAIGYPGVYLLPLCNNHWKPWHTSTIYPPRFNPEQVFTHGLMPQPIAHWDKLAVDGSPTTLCPQVSWWFPGRPGKPILRTIATKVTQHSPPTDRESHCTNGCHISTSDHLPGLPWSIHYSISAGDLPDLYHDDGQCTRQCSCSSPHYIQLDFFSTSSYVTRLFSITDISTQTGATDVSTPNSTFSPLRVTWLYFLRVTVTRQKWCNFSFIVQWLNYHIRMRYPVWIHCCKWPNYDFCISQGSVATHLRWGGIFINNFIANFKLSTSVKELWKSVNI